MRGFLKTPVRRALLSTPILTVLISSGPRYLDQPSLGSVYHVEPAERAQFHWDSTLLGVLKDWEGETDGRNWLPRARLY